MGAGHLAAFAHPGIERSQAGLGPGERAAAKQQGHTQYRASHCSYLHRRPRKANAVGTMQVAAMARAHGSHSARYRAERICEETFARAMPQFRVQRTKLWLRSPKMLQAIAVAGAARVARLDHDSDGALERLQLIELAPDRDEIGFGEIARAAHEALRSPLSESNERTSASEKPNSRQRRTNDSRRTSSCRSRWPPPCRPPAATDRSVRSRGWLQRWSRPASAKIPIRIDFPA